MCLDCVYKQLKKLRKEVRHFMATFAEDVAVLKAANKKTNDALVNIAGDVVNLDKMIQDLKDQIAASGTVLTPADQAAFDTLVAEASAAADKAQTIADQTPEPPPPPPPPGQ